MIQLSHRLLHCVACHWGHSYHDGFEVLGGNIVSDLSTVRFWCPKGALPVLGTIQKSLGSTCFVFSFLGQPVLNIGIWPLCPFLTFLSTPLCFSPFHLIVKYWSDWCQMSFLVLFSTTLNFTRGLKESMMPIKILAILQREEAGGSSQPVFLYVITCNF